MTVLLEAAAIAPSDKLREAGACATQSSDCDHVSDPASSATGGPSGCRLQFERAGG